MKEEVDFDPTKTETLRVRWLKLNDQYDQRKGTAISGSMPWIINDVEDKIQTALGMCHLTSLDVTGLMCKS